MAPPPRSLTLADPSDPARPRHLAYYEWGDPANPDTVICVHGLSRNGRDFDYLARALAGRYRVICPDMAGRGKSDWLNNTSFYNYSLYVADCLALLQLLGLRAVDWVGTSMGGIIGMMIAAMPQGFIRRLVLNDVGAVVSAAGLKRILTYVGTAGHFATAEEAMAYLKGILASFGIRTQEEWQFMFEASLTPLPGGGYALAYDPGIATAFREASAQAGAIADVDLTAVWNAIACPALILHGEQSDILTHATAQAMCTRAPATRLVEFAGVGHAPALLDSAQIRAITDWLT